MAKLPEPGEAEWHAGAAGAALRDGRTGTTEGTVEMAQLGALERRRFEELLGMASGGVLAFSDPDFRDFVMALVDRDISDPRYNGQDSGLADRLRAFCTLEPADRVATLLEALLDRAERDAEPDRSLVSGCRETVARLRDGVPQPEGQSGDPSPQGRDFDVVAGAVRASIEANAPEVGLNRLYTFVTGYVRDLAAEEGLEHADGTPLSTLFQAVIDALRSRGAIESHMAERILDSAISTLEWFDEVRGSRPFGREDPLLSYNEALFIFDHVSSVIRFLATVAEVSPDTGSLR